MNKFISPNRAGRMVLLVLMLSSLTVSSGLAFGSKEKTPAEKVAENARKANDKYNSGVKHMTKAKAIEQKSDSSTAFNYRATSEAKAKGEYKKAVKDFKDAVAQDSTLKEAYNNLGFSLRKLGEYQESLEAYNHALALDSSFAQAREYRGELYLAMGDLAGAQTELGYLQKLESPYADTLSLSIALYRISQANKAVPEEK